MRLYRIAVTAIVLLSPCLALAQVYKCVGKDGRVQYSQTKPRDSDCQSTSPAAPAASGGNVDSLMKYSQELDKSRQQENKQQQKTERQQAQQEARCSSARSRAALLEQPGRLFIVDEKGERNYQDDAQRRQQQEAARQAVARECG